MKAVDGLRKMFRQQHKYESSWVEDEKGYMICNEDASVQGKLLPSTAILIVDKAAPILKV